MYASYLSTKRALYFVVIRRQDCCRKCIVSTASNLRVVEYLTSMVQINTVPTIFEALCHAFPCTLRSWEGNSAWWLQSLQKKIKIKFYMKSFAFNGISENFSSSVLKFNVHKNLDLNAWTFEKKMPFLHQSPRVPCYGSVSVKLLHPFSLHPKTLHRQPVCLLSLHL